MKPKRVADKYINVRAIKEYADTHNISFRKALHEVLGIVVDEIKQFEYSDLIYENVVRYAETQNSFTVDMLQDTFDIGFARAMRLIDKLKENGFIQEKSGVYYPFSDRYKS
ncbi:MAG: DNA translocase FtsK [Patescibacteria group bacterium]